MTTISLDDFRLDAAFRGVHRNSGRRIIGYRDAAQLDPIWSEPEKVALIREGNGWREVPVIDSLDAFETFLADLQLGGVAIAERRDAALADAGVV